MSRRYEEVRAKADRELAEVKTVLKRLPDASRLHIIRWLLKFYEDNGAMKSPQAGKPRRRVTIDGQEFLLVAVVKSKMPIRHRET